MHFSTIRSGRKYRNPLSSALIIALLFLSLCFSGISAAQEEGYFRISEPYHEINYDYKLSEYYRIFGENGGSVPFSYDLSFNNDLFDNPAMQFSSDSAGGEASYES